VYSWQYKTSVNMERALKVSYGRIELFLVMCIDIVARRGGPNRRARCRCSTITFNLPILWFSDFVCIIWNGGSPTLPKYIHGGMRYGAPCYIALLEWLLL
jgi:hypothetical protein